MCTNTGSDQQAPGQAGHSSWPLGEKPTQRWPLSKDWRKHGLGRNCIIKRCNSMTFDLQNMPACRGKAHRTHLTQGRLASKIPANEARACKKTQKCKDVAFLKKILRNPALVTGIHFRPARDWFMGAIQNQQKINFSESTHC